MTEWLCVALLVLAALTYLVVWIHRSLTAPAREAKTCACGDPGGCPMAQRCAGARKDLTQN